MIDKWFKIRKGERYATHLPRLYMGSRKEWDITFQFGIGCNYSIPPPDYWDINKLFGVSFGLHHWNSIRLGWRSVDGGKIALYSYVYNRGVRTDKMIGMYNQLMIYKVQLNLRVNEGLVEIIGMDINTDQSKLVVTIPYKYPWFRLGYYLFPYFGGNRKAPRNINIYLNVNG